MVMFAYRFSVQESTMFTPYYMMFGREARLPVDVMFGGAASRVSSEAEHVRDLREELEDGFDQVRDRLQFVQMRQKVYYEKNTKGDPFKKDDRVWLSHLS